MCNTTITNLDGAALRNSSVPLGKMIWPTGTTLPGIGSWPISKDMFLKYMEDFDAPGSGGSGDKQAVLFDAFGGPGKTGAENAAAFRNALSEAKVTGINRIRYGSGVYVQDALNLEPSDINDVIIEGNGLSTTIQMSDHPTAGGGLFWLRGTTGVTIRNLQIDIEDTTVTGGGGIWVSGYRNLVENVTCKNGDGFSICVIGSKPVGESFVPTPTFDNIVRNCVITGQRRYHSIGGKAALLVAESATRTVCENILIVDNFLAGGETGDYAGNDHGLHTTFRNLVCINTTGTIAAGAALHLEGEQALDDMYVTVENFTAINFTVGTSVSEKTKATYVGKNTIKDCKYAIRAYGEYTSTFNNFECIGCGVGLGSSDTEGVINSAKSAVFRNIKTTGSLAKCSFVNYNASAPDSVSVPTDLIDCEFDKIVQLSYSNVGSYWVNMRGGRLLSTTLAWYNNVGLRVNIDDVYFYRSVINGYRSDMIRVHSCTFEGSGTGTAVTCDPADDKVYITNSLFKSYAYVYSGAKLGFGNVWTSITNAPPTSSPDADAYVQGTPNSRTKYITDLNDITLKSGFYTVYGTTGTTHAPTDSFGFDFWHVHVQRLENSAGNSGPWMKQTITNLDNSLTYCRVYKDQGAGSWTAWVRVYSSDNADVNFANLPTYATNAAASSLATGTLYKTATGEVRVKV